MIYKHVVLGPYSGVGQHWLHCRYVGTLSCVLAAVVMVLLAGGGLGGWVIAAVCDSGVLRRSVSLCVAC